MAAKKLTPLQETEARREANEAAKRNKKIVTRTDEEKAVRRARVDKAKDALARSASIKGDHVASSREALKDFLRRLNEPNQPDEERFQAMVEAPFRLPPKKNTNSRY